MILKFNYSLLLTALLFLGGCKQKQTKEKEQQPKKDWTTTVVDVDQLKKTDFVASLENTLPENKNSIYCASLLFAFQELKDHLGNTVKVNDQDRELANFVNTTTHLQTLSKNEYSSSFIKTIDGYEVTAAFEKSLPFAISLDSFNNRLKFDNKKVMSFGLTGDKYEVRNSISVFFYKNDRDFIVGLQPKDTMNEVLLYRRDAKGVKDMTFLFNEIKQKRKQGDIDSKSDISYWRSYFTYYDQLIIPVINFNIKKTFERFMHKPINFDRKTISLTSVFQRTAFQLNHLGTKIETEAVVATTAPAAAEKTKDDPKPKNLIFDQPFFIVLKKKNSPNPYFMAYIQNTELMQLEK